MSSDQVQWIQAIAAVVQAIAAIMIIGVTYHLTQKSVEISKQQKEISESLFNNASEMDDQIRKKVSIVLQLKLIEIEDSLRTFTNQANCLGIVNLDIDVDISTEMLIKYLSVKQYKEFLDVLKDFSFLRKGFRESSSGCGYFIPDEAHSNANRIIDTTRRLKFELAKIIDIDSGMNFM
ncbi:hypothetical protein [Desulfosporosinus sp. FKB]|uniref:hypothetical protein n=1 Tax=Desulfosporosinus sp. FKB TaxID=1969835 RepID=UPI000B4A2EE6|nr:hypothetical protein [Desulfosporosinus sp. FKB]